MQVFTMMCGESIHRHQRVTRERNGHTEEFVVVGVDDEAVYVQDPDFEFDRIRVDEAKWTDENFRAAVAADGTPEFAY